MRKNYFKIQMLAGKRLKICVGADFEISSTLIHYFSSYENKESFVNICPTTHNITSIISQLG